jgi:hypothetical protein
MLVIRLPQNLNYQRDLSLCPRLSRSLFMDVLVFVFYQPTWVLARCHTYFPAHRLCSWSDPPWSMSSSSAVCNPAERYLTSKFSYFHFSNPTHKTKTGIASRWETANSKSPGAIIMISQWGEKKRTSSQITFIILFSGKCKALLCLSPVSANCAKAVGQNHFGKPNSHCWLSVIQF